MDNTLKKDIEAIVAEIFSQKEEAEKREKTEQALQKSAETIESLTAALEEKNSKETEVASQIADFESKIAQLTSELEAAKKEVEKANLEVAESEKVIEDMKKDKAAEVRMTDLVTAGVALSDKVSQTAKVREMTDEEFATYKTELVEIRKAVEAEMAKAAETAESEEEEEETASEEEEVTTPPANVDPKQAATAALNLEVQPEGNSIISKYAALGKAMAERMKKDK